MLGTMARSSVETAPEARRVALLACAAIASSALLGCRTSHSSATASSSSAAPSAEGCVDEVLRQRGRVSSMSLSATTAAFCLAAEGADARCFSASLADGQFFARPGAAPLQKSARVQSAATAVTVCPEGGGCRSITAEGFEGADTTRIEPGLAAHMPADASADGSKLFLVRHEGRDAVQIYGEAYDVASGKRLSRFELPFDGRVERVRWLDDVVFVVGCVTSGPACSGRLVDPVRGEIGDVDGNFYGIDGAVQPVGLDRFVYVSSGGRSVVVRTERGDLVKATEISPGAEDELGVAARVQQGARELVIAYGGPIAGDVVRVDLGTMRQIARATPKACGR